MGKSSSQNVTTLKSLVAICSPNIKKKNVLSQTWILQICTAIEKLSWKDNYYAQMSQPEKCKLWKNVAKN